MPRRSRIDAPGAVHHIIARGINRQRIFKGDADRDNLLDPPANILSETQTDCFAWAKEKGHILTVCCSNPVLVTHIVFDEAEKNLI
jgi:hypothetical protein